jgi:uncharacterized protein
VRSLAPPLGRALALALLCFAVPSIPARAQDSLVVPPDQVAIPRPVGYVNDLAGVLDERDRARLEAFIDQLKRKTGAEFGVLVVRTTAPLTPSEYKVKVFESWGLGEKGKDNGLLMLVALEEREVRFETGYGLEGTLPDGLQSRVFREVMAPRFRQGDYAGGIREGVLRIAARIAAEAGVTLEWDGRELRYSNGAGRLPKWLVALIAFTVIVVVIIGTFTSGGGGSGSRRRRRRQYMGWDGWGGYGGWGGGFGGFGGGGGGGGGGSFGGFGGGASGGGGGGGRW